MRIFKQIERGLMSKELNPICKINMTVSDDSDFLSPYSPVASPIVSGDVAEFLENGANKFLPKQQIELNVRSNCIDGEEQVLYDKAIRNYFNLKLDGMKLALRRNLIVSVIFTVIGILGLVAMVLIDHFFGSAVWTEVVDIFAWVFVWEAVDQFFIERRKLLLERKKYQAFTNVNINWVKALKEND